MYSIQNGQVVEVVEDGVMFGSTLQKTFSVTIGDTVSIVTHCHYTAVGDTKHQGVFLTPSNSVVRALEWIQSTVHAEIIGCYSLFSINFALCCGHSCTGLYLHLHVGELHVCEPLTPYTLEIDINVHVVYHVHVVGA